MRQYGARSRNAEHAFYQGTPELAMYHDSLRSPEDIRNEKEAFYQSRSTNVNPETETALNGPLKLRYTDFVGDTPMIDLSHLVPNRSPGVKLYAKPEFLNPGFSIKDRIAKHIIETAEQNQNLHPGNTVVAASSGNTGAATALFCSAKGYKCVVTTSDKCSKEKQEAISAYGASISVCDNDKYMAAATAWAKEYGWFDMDQYDNLLNPCAHELSTGKEIFQQTNGKVTHVVAAGSTGGTISGIGKYMKSQNSDIKIVLADPVGSIFCEAVQNGGKHGKAKSFLVEGVGKGNIPGAMDLSLIDQVIQVTDTQAFTMCHTLAQTEGLCAGGSSGLNLFAAVQLASTLEDGIVVTVLPDGGAKYLSKVYSSKYLDENSVTLSNIIRSERSLTSSDIMYPYYHQLTTGTPLVELTHLIPRGTCSNDVRVLGKVEFFTPGFSAADRLVSTVLRELHDVDELDGKKIICDCSLYMCSTAMFCAVFGVDCIIDISNIPTDLYQSHIDICRAYGAAIVSTKIDLDDSCINIRQAVNNTNNETLAQELREQTYSALTHVVCEDSSLFNQSLDNDVMILQSSPEVGSKLFENNFKSSPKAQRISDEDILEMAYTLTKKEGLLCGRRSAMNVALAFQHAKSIQDGPACIVAILPDLGIHELPTIYSSSWLTQNEIQCPSV